jgi:hypothetical protein
MLGEAKIVIGRNVDQRPPVGILQATISETDRAQAPESRAGVKRGQFPLQQAVERPIH